MTETYGETNSAPPAPPWAQPAVPTKVCPSCSAQNQTADSKCPSCGKKFKKGHTFLKVLLTVVIGGLVLLGGCVALIAGGANKANDDAKKTGITRAQFDAVAQGTSQAVVEAKLGKPEDKQQFENKVPGINSTPQSSSCIYYHEKGEGLVVSSFQLCFDNGQLSSKNSY